MNFCAFYQSQQSAAVNQYHQLSSRTSGHCWPLVSKVLDKRTTSPRFLSSSSSPSTSSTASTQQQQPVTSQCNYSLQPAAVAGDLQQQHQLNNLITNSVISGQFWSPAATNIWSNRPGIDLNKSSHRMSSSFINSYAS